MAAGSARAAYARARASVLLASPVAIERQTPRRRTVQRYHLKSLLTWD